MADAGITWKDVQFAFGGSYEVDNPDAVVNYLGLTGLPFTDVYNGCATAASALTQAANTIRLGEYDIGMAIGMDKHLPGAFAADPVQYGVPSWYGETGLFLTPKFFAMKLQRYMYDFDISPQTLARVAAKNYRNGARNPNAFRRQPLSEEAILESPLVNDPLTQYMFCSPDEGAAAVVLCRPRSPTAYTDKPIYPSGIGRAHPPPRGLRGAQPVASARSDRSRRPSTPPGRPMSMAGVGSRRRRRGSVARHRRRRRGHPHGRERILQGRRAGGADRRRSHRDRRDPPREHRRGAHRQRRAHRRVRAAPGARARAPAPQGQPASDRSPVPPAVGYSQLYGAPGTAGVAIVST